jgi:hypothetical protein
VDVFLHLAILEFIHLISSEANEICEQDSKKTIAPEHIIGALKVCPRLCLFGSPLGAQLAVRLLTLVIAYQRLGFETFTEEVEDVLKDHKQQQKVCIFVSSSSDAI